MGPEQKNYIEQYIPLDLLGQIHPDGVAYFQKVFAKLTELQEEPCSWGDLSLAENTEERLRMALSIPTRIPSMLEIGTGWSRKSFFEPFGPVDIGIHIQSDRIPYFGKGVPPDLLHINMLYPSTIHLGGLHAHMILASFVLTQDAGGVLWNEEQAEAGLKALDAMLFPGGLMYGTSADVGFYTGSTLEQLGYIQIKSPELQQDHPNIIFQKPF